MKNILAILIGALTSIMISFNGELSIGAGNYLSSVIIHIVGLITVIAILISNKYKVKFDKELPLHMYCAGAIGVFVVLLNNITFAILGASLTIALGLLGQSVASIVIEHFGLLGIEVNKFEKKKIVGIIMIVIGIIVMTIY